MKKSRRFLHKQIINKAMKAIDASVDPSKYGWPGPRHLRRSVARENMARQGATRINRFMRYNWRRFAEVSAEIRRACARDRAEQEAKRQKRNARRKAA